jgi:hypothetical protein
MKRPSSTALFGFILIVLAGVIVVATRDGGVTGGEDSPASVAHRDPATPSRDLAPNSSTGDTPSVEPPLVLTAGGLADFSNYDRDGDGNPEVGAFLGVFRRVETSAAKIDLLDNVRTFVTLDEPQLNDLLIDQAAKAEDPEVRRAAREALFEHGGAKAHEALAAYLETETRAADRQDLDKLLGDLQHLTLNQFRSRSKTPTTTPSPPSTNN